MDEAPFWIAVNGTRRIVLSCAPGDAGALAIGHLIGEGWIRASADVLAFAEQQGPGGSAGADVTIPAELAARAEAHARHVTGHGCGLRHYLDCNEPPPHVRARMPDGDLTAVFRALFARADAASPTGGVHAAALAAGAAIDCVAVDVARHCAVDRVIGAAARAGIAGGLVLTSRISAAMVLKAARAGIPWIASRSIATPLAHALAARCGVTIVEQAVRRRARESDEHGAGAADAADAEGAA